MIRPDIIDKIVSAVNIVDVIGDRIELKKTGKNYSARCPFHDEKTPSFVVNEAQQYSYCFGCGASGDAIGFLMDYERITFNEALEKLSQITGIPLQDDLTQSKPIISKRMMTQLEDRELTEKLVIAIYEDGGAFNDDDRRRYHLANARLKEINKMKMNM